MLAQIAAKQELIMQTGGMANPLAGIPEYRNTLARMLETANIADVSTYFKQLPPGFAPPPAPPPAAGSKPHSGPGAAGPDAGGCGERPGE